MGAALTYARRYALFTLVGIAGEDDLDAPDLALPAVDPGFSNGPPAKKSRSKDQLPPSRAKTLGANGAQTGVLSAEASVTLREKLLTEIEGLEPQDDLDAWTFHAWQKANTLTCADGDQVREAFQARLARLQTTTDEGVSPVEPDRIAAGHEPHSPIDQGWPAIPESKH